MASTKRPEVATVWQALQRGQSVRERRQQLERAHERFVEEFSAEIDQERQTRFAAESGLRPVVLDSWLRAQRSTLDPDRRHDAPALSNGELQELRRVHPISRVLPVVHRLLGDAATESGFIIAIGDAEGRLLWVDGDHSLRSEAEDMGFRAGMDWSERTVGTSAPGSALELDHAIQVLGAEHYNRGVHRWSCAAVPVHDPVTGSIIGVLDVTGGDEVVAPHVLPLLEATAAAAQAELRLDALRTQLERERVAARAAHAGTSAVAPPARRAGAPRLVVLGRGTAVLECASGAHELGGRHAEILLTLALNPGGLSARELAASVYGEHATEHTLRPELARLRRWLSEREIDIEISSRPYRLDRRVKIDAQEMLAALGRGAHRVALAAYTGPVLPNSEAPTAVELRTDVDGTLRESMLQSAAPDHLFEYAQRWAQEDAEVWETLLRTLPARSPKRARVVTVLEELARVHHGDATHMQPHQPYARGTAG